MTQLISPAPAVPADPSPQRTASASGSVAGQGLRFTLVGSAGTGLQLALYAATSALLGAQLASVASWLLSTLVTNAAHRALTFRVRGGDHNRSDQVAAFLTCVVGLLITSLVLAELPDATGTSGVIAILAVNTLVGAARFVGMRWWLTESGQSRVRQISITFSMAVSVARNSWQSHRGMSALHH